VFSKAARKVQEASYFVRQLALHADPDSSEFSFNALLASGKNVVNTIRAALIARERQRGTARPAFTKLLNGLRMLFGGKRRDPAQQVAIKAYRKTHRAWRRGRTQQELDLFDVLQEMRDVEVHTTHEAATQTPRHHEKQIPRRIPEDPRYLAVYANYLAMGMLSHTETVTETTCHFSVDTSTGRNWKHPQALARVAARGPVQTSLIATEYCTILQSLLDFFRLKHP